MTKARKPAKPLPLAQRWDGETGFRLGEFNEKDMRLMAGGVVPGWLQRVAASLLVAQKKYTIRFRRQKPGYMDTQV